MKLHRFIGNFEFSKSSLRVLDRELLHQLKNTLRLAVGDEVMLGDSALHEARARIVRFFSDGVEFEIIETHRNANEPKRAVTLYCSLLKRENFEWVLQKATEAGVHAIVPLVAARTVKLGFKNERLRKIIKEAAEQSGRGLIPDVQAPQPLDAVLVRLAPGDTHLFFHTAEERRYNTGMLAQSERASIFIGPEGGWTDEEVDRATQANCAIVSLGPLTLRAETAAIIATFLAAQN